MYKRQTLDRGSDLFDKAATGLKVEDTFPGDVAYDLYSTFGFPEGLTKLKCTQNGFVWDKDGFDQAKKKHSATGKAGQQETIVRALDITTEAVTEFLGFDTNSCEATVLEVHDNLVITDKTVLFTEMGGQEGDSGTLGNTTITGTQKIGAAIGHVVAGDLPSVGDTVTISLDRDRRAPIEAHHTATHLLHWALHEVVSKEASQQGSCVSPDRLRFDFNSKALTVDQVTTIEEKVNATIQAGDTVSWVEVPHTDINCLLYTSDAADE